MMVPIQVIRWYRMQCYDGTDSCATVVPIRRYCQNILLVDDLYKSGLTMQYVAMMLKNAGCSRVFGLTLVKSLGNN